MENETPGASTPPQSSAPQTPPPSAPSQSSNTGMAILAYLGILIIIPFLTEAHKDSFVKFHIKQGLVLIIAEVAASILAIIPILGWVLSPILWIISVIMIIIGIVNVVNNREKELPIIGKYASHFNF
jgi:uncharacterized membrane protein